MARRMRRRVAVLWACSAVAAASAQPQVYQCRQGGRMVFSDQPCGADAQALKVRSGGADGDIRFDVPTRHYKVDGASLEQAYAAIRASNPEGFAGFARWKVDYRYRAQEEAGRCRLTQVTVQVQGDILMPEWVQEAQAAGRERAQWRSMYTDLKRHEDGHIQHGREFATLLKGRLLGLGAVPCAEVATRAQQEYQLLYGNLQRRDEEYDRRTDHGLRQDNPR